MSIYYSMLVRAYKNTDRTLETIADEYSVFASECIDTEDYVDIAFQSGRNQSLTAPNNGDLWAWCCDDGTSMTNDADGADFEYWVSIENKGEFFVNHTQLIELFEKLWKKSSSSDFHYSIAEINEDILPLVNDDEPFFDEDVTPEERAFIKTIQDTFGYVYISKLSVIK